MKKNLPILTLLALSLLTFSCKKLDKAGNEPVSLTYKVSFSISGGNSLKSENSPGTLQINDTGGSSLASQFSVLVYNIFDARGNQIRQLTQQATDKNFGTINDLLPPGNYRVIIAAGQANMFQKSVATPSTNYTYCAYLQDNTPIGPFYDTFYKDTSITVASAPVNQAISLKRINAELEIKINDALPANADHFTYSFDNEYLAFDLLKGQPIPSNIYVSYATGQPGVIDPSISTATVSTIVKIPASAVGTTSFMMDHIVLNTLGTHTVTLTCFDAQSNVIETKTIANVTFKINTKTVLSGNLFGSVNQSAVSTPVNWGSTMTVNF